MLRYPCVLVYLSLHICDLLREAEALVYLVLFPGGIKVEINIGAIPSIQILYMAECRLSVAKVFATT